MTFENEERILLLSEDETEETEFQIMEGSPLEEQLLEEDFNEESPPLRLDFTIQSPEERNELVKKIIENTPPEKLTDKYIKKLSDYIIFAMNKKERLSHYITTDNRFITVNLRETSFEGLISKLENGEDGIYNMIANDKNIIFSPKAPITEKDLNDVPYLRALRETINSIEEQAKNARGRKAFQLRKQLIELRQDQYTIKAAFRKPIYAKNVVKSIAHMDLTDYNITIAADGHVASDAKVSIFNPDHISLVLSNYSRLKEETYDLVKSDMKWFLLDLESLIDAAIEKQYPLYYDLLIMKIDGRTNIEIQTELQIKYGIKHSVEYISSLWRNKIPKLIAHEAENRWLIYHFTFEERGKWKKCSRCGEIKLAHNNFFSKNKTSKDSFYSICKKCRNNRR